MRRSMMSREEGFTFFEIIFSLTLFAAVSIFVLQGFIAGMSHAGRSDEQSAATTLASQVMEQIRASVNPYEMVGFTDLPRTPLPLPSPYGGVGNPSSHPFEVAVDVNQNTDLRLTTATVEVYRPADAAPYLMLVTVLDDQ